MKEIEPILKAVADGLKVMAQGINSIANKVNKVAKEQDKGKNSVKKSPPATAKRKVKARVIKKTTPKKAIEKPAQKKKPQVDISDTALNTVYKIIKKSKAGINSTALMEKTGYDRKKVHNRLYKLKKQGKIKNVSKGIYSVI